MEPGQGSQGRQKSKQISWSQGERFRPGQVGSWVIVTSDLGFDPVLSFNTRVYRGVVSNIISANHKCPKDDTFRNVVTSQETETTDINPRFRFLVTSQRFWI